MKCKKKIKTETLETVVAEVITEEVVEPTGRTELEKRQNLWNVEKMRSDLKVLLEKERFGR